jgi:hypothetical protein
MLIFDHISELGDWDQRTVYPYSPGLGPKVQVGNCFCIGDMLRNQQYPFRSSVNPAIGHGLADRTGVSILSAFSPGS